VIESTGDSDISSFESPFKDNSRNCYWIDRWQLYLVAIQQPVLLKI